MSGVETVTVAAADADLRLDRWFKREYPQVTHGRLEKLLRTGQVRIDGKRAKASTRLIPGQAVRVPPLPDGAAPAPRPVAEISTADRDALRDAILYRDDWVIVLDKAAGLAVQGGSGQTRHLDGLLDALRFDAEERPRLVHRLDKDTAGVLLLARSAAAARALTASFRSKATEKVYWALVAGVPPQPRGRIALSIGKTGGPGAEKVTADPEGGKDAVTLFHVVQSQGKQAAWLVLRPLTGRTHQLRAHCALMGTPILGDGKYGGKAAFRKDLPNRLMLQAHSLALPHPDDGTTLRVVAPLPDHMAEAWDRLGFDPNRGEPAAEALARYAEGLRHSPGRDGSVQR